MTFDSVRAAWNVWIHNDRRYSVVLLAAVVMSVSGCGGEEEELVDSPQPQVEEADPPAFEEDDEEIEPLEDLDPNDDLEGPVVDGQTNQQQVGQVVPTQTSPSQTTPMQLGKGKGYGGKMEPSKKGPVQQGVAQGCMNKQQVAQGCALLPDQLSKGKVPALVQGPTQGKVVQYEPVQQTGKGKGKGKVPGKVPVPTQGKVVQYEPVQQGGKGKLGKGVSQEADKGVGQVAKQGKDIGQYGPGQDMSSSQQSYLTQYSSGMQDVEGSHSACMQANNKQLHLGSGVYSLERYVSSFYGNDLSGGAHSQYGDFVAILYNDVHNLDQEALRWVVQNGVLLDGGSVEYQSGIASFSQSQLQFATLSQGHYVVSHSEPSMGSRSVRFNLASQGSCLAVYRNDASGDTMLAVIVP